VGMRRLSIDSSVDSYTVEFGRTSQSLLSTKTTHKALPSKSEDSGIRRIPRRPARFKKGTPVPVKSKR
jgi:hypothetical protein